jgi:hypothetical protein
MCDYSLHNVASRPARVGDKLTTRDFGTGTRGFAASESARVAVCVLPGTELAFANPVECRTAGLLGWGRKVTGHRTAIFRQINKERPAAHPGDSSVGSHSSPISSCAVRDPRPTPSLTAARSN